MRPPAATAAGRGGGVGGIHFEGPYLSESRCGAQNPEFLRDPSTEELTELIDLGAGAVADVTLAPERDGALEAIKLLTGRGVVAAVWAHRRHVRPDPGRRGEGASGGTHLFQRDAPHAHREPGPIVALLSAPNVVCELVADGVHLHDGMLAFATSTAAASAPR